MTTDTAARVAADYLSRLERAGVAAGLSESRRAELQEQIGEHLDEARRQPRGDPATATLDAIDRLGDPEAIVAEAADPAPDGAAPLGASTARPEPWIGPLEIVAMLGIALGWLLFGFGAFVGIAALLVSARWRPWEKALTVLAPLGPIAASIIFVGAGGSSDGGGQSDLLTGLYIVLTLLLVLAPFIATAFLYTRLRRRNPARGAAA